MDQDGLLQLLSGHLALFSALQDAVVVAGLLRHLVR